MRNQKFRRPDRCARHSREGTFRKMTWQADWEHGKRYQLIQYECGEGCSSKLGWEFHGLGGEFRSGGRECRDERVLRTMELASMGEEHNGRMAVIFSLAFTAGIIGLILLSTATLWGAIAGLSAIIAAAGAVVLSWMSGPREEMPELG